MHGGCIFGAIAGAKRHRRRAGHPDGETDRRFGNQCPGTAVETAETPNSIIVSGIVIVISRSIARPSSRYTGERESETLPA